MRNGIIIPNLQAGQPHLIIIGFAKLKNQVDPGKETNKLHTTTKNRNFSLATRCFPFTRGVNFVRVFYIHL